MLLLLRTLLLRNNRNLLYCETKYFPESPDPGKNFVKLKIYKSIIIRSILSNNSPTPNAAQMIKTPRMIFHIPIPGIEKPVIFQRMTFTVIRLLVSREMLWLHSTIQRHCDTKKPGCSDDRKRGRRQVF